MAIIKDRPDSDKIAALLERLNRQQCFTSVLVAYELYRGIPALPERRKYQERIIKTLSEKFTHKSVTYAHAMRASNAFRYSDGDIDPLIAAQAIDGDYTLVTLNRKHFERIPGIRLHTL